MPVSVFLSASFDEASVMGEGDHGRVSAGEGRWRRTDRRPAASTPGWPITRTCMVAQETGRWPHTEHLWLDRGVVVRPGHEDELVRRGARLGVDLNVQDSVPAVSLRERGFELVETSALLSLLFDHDGFLIIGDLEDHVLVGAADLHLLKFLQAFLVALHTGRLRA